jgi:hypothetical protein
MRFFCFLKLNTAKRSGRSGVKKVSVSFLLISLLKPMTLFCNVCEVANARAESKFSQESTLKLLALTELTD